MSAGHDGQAFATALLVGQRHADHGVEMIDVSMFGDNLAALRLLRGLAGRPALQLDHGIFEASIPLAG